MSNEKKLEAVEAKLEKLKAEKKLLVAKQKELTSVYDELRFEVRNAGLNGPSWPSSSVPRSWHCSGRTCSL